VFDWHSRFAAHKMTIPLRGLTYSVPELSEVSLEAWDTSTVLVETMLDLFVAAWHPTAQVTSAMDFVTVYDYKDALPVPRAVATKVYGTAGTDDTDGWDEGTQVTLTGRDLLSKPVRLVLLDVATGNNFARLFFGDIVTAYKNLWNVLSDPTLAFSSRQNARPDTLIQQAVTINDKLRRNYGLN
jgi:hypothetical protein